MVCPVALVHTLKGNRAQLSLYLQQVEMILAAAVVYMKHDGSKEADLTVGSFLFMFSEVYLSFSLRKIALPLKKVGLKQIGVL